MNLAFQLAGGFGTVSAAGVFTEKDLPVAMGRGFAKDLTIAMGMANVIGVFDQVIPLIESGGLDPTPLVSHRLPFDEVVQGYRMFSEQAALKVVLDVHKD